MKQIYKECFHSVENGTLQQWLLTLVLLLESPRELYKNTSARLLSQRLEISSEHVSVIELGGHNLCQVRSGTPPQQVN